MRLYDCTTAPSPRRVRIFLAEKKISLPLVQVDLRNGEQFSPAFRAVNPDCTVPVLELEDGTRIRDAIGICRYFEALQPSPSLMGKTPVEQAQIESWQRQVERDGFYAVMEAFRNATPGLKDRGLPGPTRFEQIPALAERGRVRIQNFHKVMEERLGQSDFVAGPNYSIADITALITIDFARWMKLPIPAECAKLQYWYDKVNARPSAQA